MTDEKGKRRAIAWQDAAVILQHLAGINLGVQLQAPDAFL
jgi:hypothetical protein